MNILLRIVVGITTIFLVAAGANYYLHLGWFGDHGRPILTTMLLVTIIVLSVAIRLWREPRQ